MRPPKDYETYIHRSGRTGRAGRKGISITIFTKSQSGTMKYIEQRVGIEFRRIGIFPVPKFIDMLGTPQPEDIIESAALGMMKKVKEVHESVVPFFADAAKKLISGILLVFLVSNDQKWEM